MTPGAHVDVFDEIDTDTVFDTAWLTNCRSIWLPSGLAFGVSVALGTAAGLAAAEVSPEAGPGPLAALGACAAASAVCVLLFRAAVRLEDRVLRLREDEVEDRRAAILWPVGLLAAAAALSTLFFRAI